MLCEVVSKENLSVSAVVYISQLFGESVFCYHFTCYICCLLYVAGSSDGNIIKLQVFGSTATHASNDVAVHSLLGFKEHIVLRKVHGVSAGSASRNDCNLVNRQVIRKGSCHNCVSGLMVSCKLLFLVRNHLGLLGRSHFNLAYSLFDFFHSDESAVSASCNESRLVEYVFKISRCAAHSSSGKH